MTDFAPTDEQQAVIDGFQSGSDLAVSALAGTGKALRDDQRVVTPTGFVPISDLSVGDLVCGTDGRSYPVLGVYPQGERELVSIEFSDGSAVVCDLDHIWTVQNSWERTRTGKTRNMTAQELSESRLYQSVTTVKGTHKKWDWYLPAIEPPRFVDQTLPVPPYLLGALLGDGGLRGSAVNFCCPDEMVQDRVREEATPFGVELNPSREDEMNFRLSSRDNLGKSNRLLDALRDLGVADTLSVDKMIPKSYLLGSPDDRLSLLHGLMDTDGHRSSANSAEFTSSSRTLAEQVKLLIESLGGTAAFGEKPEPTYTHNGEKRVGQPSYRLYVRMPSGRCPFWLTRKAEGWGLGAQQKSPPRTIRGVYPVSAGNATCIEVGSPDKLFLTENFIPTHNTTTMRLVAEASPGERGLYFAYNKAAADEAAGEFPSTIECRTAHSLAYRAVGHQYRDRLNASRKPPWEIAKFLGIGGNDWQVTPTVKLKPWQIARLALDAVQRFCYSAEDEVKPWHIPKVEGVQNMDMIRSRVLPFAQKAWEDVQDPHSDGVQFVHDHYLAIWVRSNPELDYDYILLDEGQDSNGCVARLFEGQGHAQRVIVGDRWQTLYAWRASEDLITKFALNGAQEHLSLTSSFRFGPAIADEGNKWLELLESELRLEGRGPATSQVIGINPKPDAILCRTNAGCIDEAIVQGELGRKASIVGGLDTLTRFVDAVEQLQNTGSTNHRDLQAFATWGEVQDYARTPDGADLSVSVRLIEKYGISTIRKAAKSVVPESRADVTISTAHRSKGRQWDSVQIGSDFQVPADPEGVLMNPDPNESMLNYVAVTRAMQTLSRGPLSAIDRLLNPVEATL